MPFEAGTVVWDGIVFLTSCLESEYFNESSIFKEDSLDLIGLISSIFADYLSSDCIITIFLLYFLEKEYKLLSSSVIVNLSPTLANIFLTNIKN